MSGGGFSANAFGSGFSGGGGVAATASASSGPGAGTAGPGGPILEPGRRPAANQPARRIDPRAIEAARRVAELLEEEALDADGMAIEIGLAVEGDDAPPALRAAVVIGRILAGERSPDPPEDESA